MAKILPVENGYPGHGALQIRYGYEHAGRLKSWYIVSKLLEVELDPEIVADYGTWWVMWDDTPTEKDREGLGWDE